MQPTNHPGRLEAVDLLIPHTQVVVSEFNSLADGRYFDAASQSSFAFDHATQKASAVQSHVLESQHLDLVYVALPLRIHLSATRRC